jgi:AcrR family transcriptional regulator
VSTNEESGESRPVGRPRRGSGPPGDPLVRDSILRVAARLFVSRGYAATSTRLISEQSGIRQAALFRYFAHKEDILAELLDRTVRPALAFADWLATSTGHPPAALCALATCDAHNLCANPDNLAGLHLIPEARDERFASFWAGRERLREAYGRYIHALVAAEDAAMRTNLVFGLVESVLIWDGRVRPDPDAVASAIGAGSLALVGAPRRSIVAAARHADELWHRYEEVQRSVADPDLLWRGR